MMQGYLPYQQKQPIMLQQQPSFWERLAPSLAMMLLGDIVGNGVGAIMGAGGSAGDVALASANMGAGLYQPASDWLMATTQPFTANPFQLLLGG